MVLFSGATFIMMAGIIRAVVISTVSLKPHLPPTISTTRFLILTPNPPIL